MKKETLEKLKGLNVKPGVIESWPKYTYETKHEKPRRFKEFNDQAFVDMEEVVYIKKRIDYNNFDLSVQNYSLVFGFYSNKELVVFYEDEESRNKDYIIAKNTINERCGD